MEIVDLSVIMCWVWTQYFLMLSFNAIKKEWWNTHLASRWLDNILLGWLKRGGRGIPHPDYDALKGGGDPRSQIDPDLSHENRRMSTCNRLDLQTIGSQPIMPKNLSNQWVWRFLWFSRVLLVKVGIEYFVKVPRAKKFIYLLVGGPRDNVWGEAVFSAMMAGWCCEKSGWIGKVENVKPEL